MEVAVGFEVASQVPFLVGFFEKLVQFSQVGDLLRLCFLDRKPRRQSFQHAGNGVVILHILARGLANGDFVVGQKRDVSSRFERTQSFAKGHLSHVQRGGKRLLGESLAGSEFALNDRLPKLLSQKFS